MTSPCASVRSYRRLSEGRRRRALRRSGLARLAAGTGVLALVLAGGVALAQPHDGGQTGPSTQIVRDQATLDVAWLDADGDSGVETTTLGLSDAPDEAASAPSPLSAQPVADPANS